MHYINHNIKFFREHNRYTQQDVADKLKTTVGRVKTYEAETAVPMAEMLIKIADMMGITLDTLFKVKLSAKNYKPWKQEITVERNAIERIEQKIDLLLSKKSGT